MALLWGFPITTLTITKGGGQPDMEALLLSIAEKQYQYINALIWTGVGAILSGGFLLIAGRES